MLEDIRKSQDRMVDELSRNIIAQLRKGGTFGGFSEKMIQLLLERMQNKVEYALNDSPKAAGKLEVCYNSQVMKSLFNLSTFKYNFGGGRFHMLPRSYKFSHGLFLNNFLQVLLIGNQRDQVTPIIYINFYDDVSPLDRGSIVLGDMKYLMR